MGRIAVQREKADIDPFQPIAAFAEQELGPDGTLLDTATILIANRECPFRCIYCDLWKHTLDEPTPRGAVPQQIETAFETLGRSDFEQIKLYNAGNWFDAKAIPVEDHAAIAGLLKDTKRVIIENHPKLCDQRVLAFRAMLTAQLEIAVGVETIDQSIMARLDKSMSVDDAEQAIRFLRQNNIAVRPFLLFPPPFLVDKGEGDAIVEHGLNCLQWCFDRDATAAVLIPLRADDGIMPALVAAGDARTPTLEQLETVAAAASSHTRQPGQRVFIDTWDAARLFVDQPQVAQRVARLERFNATQELA